MIHVIVLSKTDSRNGTRHRACKVRISFQPCTQHCQLSMLHAGCSFLQDGFKEWHQAQGLQSAQQLSAMRQCVQKAQCVSQYFGNKRRKWHFYVPRLASDSPERQRKTRTHTHLHTHTNTHAHTHLHTPLLNLQVNANKQGKM